jgi:hypothetical protein
MRHSQEERDTLAVPFGPSRLDGWENRMAFAYRPELEDWTPADPPTFRTAVPSWRDGDVILLAAPVASRAPGARRRRRPGSHAGRRGGRVTADHDPSRRVSGEANVARFELGLDPLAVPLKNRSSACAGQSFQDCYSVSSSFRSSRRAPIS